MLLINSDSEQQPKLEKGEPHMQITNCNNERSVPTQLTEIMFSCESIKLRATNYTTAACYIQEIFLKIFTIAASEQCQKWGQSKLRVSHSFFTLYDVNVPVHPELFQNFSALFSGRSGSEGRVAY